MGIDVEASYRTYGAMVMRRCRALLRDEEDALDATQEVFARLIAKHETLDANAPSSLLFRMATNVSLNRIRSRSRRPEDANDELVQQIASCTSDSETLTVARSFLRVLFGSEKESTQTIAVLHLLDGMTLQEVADEVGLSVSGVRKRLRQLRARLDKLEAS